MDDKRVAIKMVVDGKEREVTFEELTLSNNLALEALVRLMVEKKLFDPKELMQTMELVRKERYRSAE